MRRFGTRALGPALFVSAGVLLLAAGCERQSPHFSEENARIHVRKLAGDIGSRPAGTDANRGARDYLVEQLGLSGFSVRVQETDATRPELGLTARVSNVLAILPGRRAEALGLLAHYDSRPETPGAADDALGVAVCLEVARLQAARADRQHSLMVLLTDAEEHGLMGAAAIVEDPEVRSRLQAFLNVEATGSAGPVLLFEAGPENGWLVRRWAAAAPHPRGGSHLYEVYRRLPNDTDFTVFRRAGIPGLNFAAVGDSYAYHTALDTPERLTRDVLRRTGELVLATLEALDRGAITVRTSERPVYFDVAGTFALVTTRRSAGVLAWIAVALAGCAWVRGAAWFARAFGPAGLLASFVWAVLGLSSATAGMIAAVWVLRVLRDIQHPWYAHPLRLWVLLGLIAALVVAILAGVARSLSARMRPPRQPAAVWLVTLPVWMIVTTAVQLLAPAAAYLWGLPLFALATAALVWPRSSGRAGQLLALLVGVVTWTLWVPELREWLRFAVPLLGRLPVVTPAWLFPAIFVVAGVMIVPPIAAFVAARAQVDETTVRRRPTHVPTVAGLAVLTAVVFAAAYAAPAYTPERPLRRTLQYVADHGSGRAAWETGANEPLFVPLADAGGPGGWAADSAAALPGLASPVPPHAFHLRASADLVRPPFTAEGRTTATGSGDTTIELTATAEEPGHVLLFMLPEDVSPLSHSLPGRTRGRRWTAAYAAAPAGPVTFRAVLPPEAAGRLSEVRVGLLAAGVPGGGGGQRPPRWAPAGPTAWSTRSLHALAPFPLATPAALR